MAHRSVIPKCLRCVGLVLTTIVHRFVWGAYTLFLFQRSWSRRTGTASVRTRPVGKASRFNYVTCNGANRNTAQVDYVT